MRALVVLVMMCACRSEAEYSPAPSEIGDNKRWWCPTAGLSTFCLPEFRKPVAGMKGAELRDWLDRSPQFAATNCIRRVATEFPGATCVNTRLVICATHDPGSNVCFLTWEMCRKNIDEHPERECAPYFDGERLQ